MTPAEIRELRNQAEREGIHERREYLQRMGLPSDHGDAELAILRGEYDLPAPTVAAPEALQ